MVRGKPDLRYRYVACVVRPGAVWVEATSAPAYGVRVQKVAAP
ncbi:hypothetical protein [Paenibacillus thalictri]|nr:hypothetical protein [Paenibacillus thalictri]